MSQWPLLIFLYHAREEGQKNNIKLGFSLKGKSLFATNKMIFQIQFRVKTKSKIFVLGFDILLKYCVHGIIQYLTKVLYFVESVV